MLTTLEQQIRARATKIAHAKTQPELLRLAAEGEQLIASLQQLRTKLLQEHSGLAQLSRFAQASRPEQPAAVVEVTV